MRLTTLRRYQNQRSEASVLSLYQPNISPKAYIHLYRAAYIISRIAEGISQRHKTLDVRFKIRENYDPTSFPKPKARSDPAVPTVTQYIAEGVYLPNIAKLISLKISPKAYLGDIGRET